MNNDRNFLIIQGNPVDGLDFIGPFPSHEAAVDHAESGKIEDGDWWICIIHAPQMD